MTTKRAAHLERDIQKVLRRGKRLEHSTRKTHAQLSHDIARSLNTPTISNRDQISDRTLRVLGDELEEAAIRAVGAGAVGDLTYQGAGATGIVFCDERKLPTRLPARDVRNPWPKRLNGSPELRRYLA